jgi:hypothetical protein
VVQAVAVMAQLVVVLTQLQVQPIQVLVVVVVLHFATVHQVVQVLSLFATLLPTQLQSVQV